MLLQEESIVRYSGPVLLLAYVGSTAISLATGY